MNTAPKLSLSIRAVTAFVALLATLAVVDSINGLSTHYEQQGARIAAAHAKSQQA